jgi:site-specific DNA-methyltransferase (adenine-specific)
MNDGDGGDDNTVELNKIYNEDCLDFMNKLGKEQPPLLIDVIVTSPPYNINKEYSYYRDNKEGEEYLHWIYQVAKKSLSILKDNGSFFLNIAGTPSDQFLPFEVAMKFQEAGYELQNTIHWIKSISFEKEDVGKSNGTIRNNHNYYNNDGFAVGHFKPIVSQRFLTDCHEYIFHFTKNADIKLDKLAIGVPYQDKTNIGRWKSAKQDRRDRGNTWFIPYPTINESRPHPAVFPEKLPNLCIKLHGVTDDLVVYDPFMGTGTTALACLELKVNYLGTEIDEEYIKLATENIHERENTIGKKEGKKVRKIIDWVSPTSTGDPKVLGER